MNGKIAPVALMIFNRPHLTAKVFEQIRAARPHRLLVVADGPRPTRPDDTWLCEASRKIVTSPDWPCELSVNFANENLGNRRRISSGLDWVFTQCPEAIVLEDDCLPCPSFFSFCSAMLERFRDDDRIMHISGNNFGGTTHWGGGSYYFSRYTFSWGWASWKRAWHHYDVNLTAWPAAKSARWLESTLESPVEISYWTEIFDKLYRYEIDTWDYQWLFSCWRPGALSILPNNNLVTNIGVGPDSLNFTSDHATIGVPTHELGELVHPKAVIRNKKADRSSFEKYIAAGTKYQRVAWLRKVRRKLALRTRMKSLLQPL